MKCLARLFFISLISSSALIFYSCANPPKAEHSDNHENDVTTVLKVDGLTCNSCKNSLEGALLNKEKFPLIHSAEVNIAEKTCTVTHDKNFSLEDLKNAIHTTEFRVVQN